jgi:hypothetical protein
VKYEQSGVVRFITKFAKVVFSSGQENQMHIFELPDDVLAQIFNHLRHGSSACCSEVVDSRDALSFAFSNSRLREIHARSCLHSLSFTPCAEHVSLSRPAALCRLAGQHMREFCLVTSSVLRIDNRQAVPLHVVLDVLSESCTELQCIDLKHANGLNWHSCSTAFRRLLHRCTKLKSLHVGLVPQRILQILAAAGDATGTKALHGPLIALQSLSLLDFGCSKEELFRVLAPFRTSLRSLAISGGIPNEGAIEETSADFAIIRESVLSRDEGFKNLEELYIGPLLFSADASESFLQTILTASRSSVHTVIFEQLECESIAALIAEEVPKCMVLKEIELRRCAIEGSLEHLLRAMGPRLTTFSSMRTMSAAETSCLRRFCPSLRALSLSYSSSLCLQAPSFAREDELLMMELQESLESLEVLHVKDVRGMMALSQITRLKHLRFHFDFQPELRAVEVFMTRMGASLQSLKIEVRGLGTSANKTEDLLQVIEENCPMLSTVELDLWHVGSLQTREQSLQDYLLRGFEARVPSCCTKWTRAHLRLAHAGIMANHQRRY